MLKLFFYLLGCVFVLAIPACNVTKESPKYQFSDGYYRASKIFRNAPKVVYADYEEDSLYVYPLKKLVHYL